MERFGADEHATSRGLPGFQSALAGWLEALTTYSTAVAGDYSWYYRERTCIGFLAAGIWRSGGVALEEWQTPKRTEAEKRQGRCDLWAFHRGRYDYHIEAKHMWSRATGERSKELGYIERNLAKATADARRLTCAPKRKVGVLFVAPFYPAGEQQRLDEHVTNWLKDVSSIPHAAIAWQFRNRRTLRASRWQLAPGLVILARKAHDTPLLRMDEL